MNFDNVDAALERLANAPGPAGLAGIEGAVLARISSERPVRQRDSLGLSALAAVGAMTLGLASGMLPADACDGPRAPLLPLTGASELAPSSLLTGHR